VTADDKGFAAEAHLRDFLAGNLDLIEHGLELFTDDNGNAGVEYVIAIGRIDILAIDSDGNFLVVELKVGKGPDDVCGQIMRYVSWVKRHLAKGKKV
jgi:RecB family endonuclease NucS